MRGAGTLNEQRTVTPQVEVEIVAAYQRGDKLLDIENRFGVARSTIYWVLERNNVQPSRVKRAVRLSGDSATLSHLYAIIQRQDDHIRRLETLLTEHNIEKPERN